MAAVFPRVLIIVDSLLRLRGFSLARAHGGTQAIFCLCNSHWPHKHKHKINTEQSARWGSDMIFTMVVTAWENVASLLLVREVCGPLLCSQDDLPHGAWDSSGNIVMKQRGGAEPKWKPPGWSIIATLHLSSDFEQLPRHDHYSEHNQPDMSDISPQGWISLWGFILPYLTKHRSALRTPLQMFSQEGSWFSSSSIAFSQIYYHECSMKMNCAGAMKAYLWDSSVDDKWANNMLAATWESTLPLAVGRPSQASNASASPWKFHLGKKEKKRAAM